MNQGVILKTENFMAVKKNSTSRLLGYKAIVLYRGAQIPDAWSPSGQTFIR